MWTLSLVVAVGALTVVTGLLFGIEAAGLLVGAAGLALTVATTFFRGERAPRLSPGELADDLAGTLREQRLEEAAERGLRNARVLPLMWSAAEEGLGDPALYQRRGRPVRLRLDGRIDGGFAAATRRLAAEYGGAGGGRRLVVVGAPGSGKSALALLLTLGLLETRERGGDDPVPVLLPASTWDPVTESMDDWIARQLGMLFGDQRAARRLLTHGLVLPIVDGLDEIPEQVRRKAVDEINAAVGHDRPVVVTCRRTEYADVIAEGATPLRRAAVVEVAPVPAGDVIDYLKEVSWPAETDWTPVYEHLREAPDGDPVAATLSTPLMVSLARGIYQRGGGDPAELLTVSDSRHGLEEHLIGRSMEAAYASGAASPGAPSTEPVGRWDADTARRYLTFLAEYLHGHRERDLVWWAVSHRLASPWAGFIIAWVFGTGVMVATLALLPVFEDEPLAPDEAVPLGGVFAGLSGALIMVAWYAGGGRAPARLSPSRRGAAERLRKGFAVGFALTLIPGVPVLIGLALINAFGGEAPVALSGFMTVTMTLVVLATVIGSAMAVHDWLNAPTHRSVRSGAAELLRQDRRSSLVGAAAASAVVGLFAVPGMVFATVLAGYAVRARSGWAGEPSLRQSWSTEFESFRGGFASGQLVALYIVLPGVVFASLILLTRAWPRFALARLVLAAQGRLPLRLLAFLDDALRRGVLRQAGATYQFQHIRLQEWLLNNRRAPVRRPRMPSRRRWVPATAGVIAVLVALGTAPTTRDLSEATLTTGSFAFEAISSNGRYLALADESGRPKESIRVWDVQQRTMIPRFLASTVIAHLAISSNGRWLAAEVRDRFIRVWDLRTGRQRDLRARGPIGALTFSPDSRALATDHREVWDVEQGRLRTSLELPPAKPGIAPSSVRTAGCSP